MSLSLFLRQEEPRGFYYVFSTDSRPLEVGRVLFCGYADGLAIDDEVTVLDLDGAVEATMHRVVLEHVGHVLCVEQVIDTYDLDVAALLGSTEDKTADTSEAVNTNFNHLTCSYR